MAGYSSKIVVNEEKVGLNDSGKFWSAMTQSKCLCLQPCLQVLAWRIQKHVNLLCD